MYLGNWSFEEPLAHLHYAASKPCSLEHKKSFLGLLKWLPELSSHCGVFIYAIFSCLWFIAIFNNHYLTQKAQFHFPKLVKSFRYWVNCRIMQEHVPAQPLPLRNIDIYIVVLLNKHENNNINKVKPYAISFDNTNYIHCLYKLQLLNQS